MFDQSEDVLKLIKEEEKRLKEKVPSFLQETVKTSPSKIFQDYQKTQDPIFKQAAGESLQQLKQASEEPTKKRSLAKLGFLSSAASLNPIAAIGMLVNKKGSKMVYQAKKEPESILEKPKEKSVVTEYSGLELDKDYQGEFTMYNPEEGQTDKDPHILASNKHIDEALTKDYDVVLAAGNRSIPLGTIVQIPELGAIGIVEDRMNKRYDLPDDNRFDILTSKGVDARQFGRQKLTFKVIGHDNRENTKIDTSMRKKFLAQNEK